MTEHALPLSQKAAQLLAERGIENARLEAELLLAHVLGIRRLDLYLQFERPMQENELERFRAVVRRRLKREPLQYIVGHTQFRALDLKVDRRALIPRPETEILVGVVLDFVGDAPARIIDIGTGTGAIALSLAKEAPQCSVVATDVSADAAELARENALANGMDLDVRVGDLWVAAPQGCFDVAVSNPPYIAETERPELQPEVRDFEPGGALFAGDDGLTVLRALITDAPARLNAGGLLALEIGSTQAAAVVALIEATSSFENIRVVRDLSGRERIVTAVRRRAQA
jgi:release factor glutamine methyltransferase